MNEILATLAPTVASAILGPLGGVAVAALGKLFGIEGATTDQISKAFQDGKMTPEQLSAIKQLEMKYKAEEQERGFKYADLEFRDRDSARKANVEGGVQKPLFWMSILLLFITLGSELLVLFQGYPPAVPEIVVGRVLGLMDAVAMTVLAYWYGTTNGSQTKNILLRNAGSK